jgi:hypothetical protein
MTGDRSRTSEYPEALHISPRGVIHEPSFKEYGVRGLLCEAWQSIKELEGFVESQAPSFPLLFELLPLKLLSFTMSKLTWYNIAICLVVSWGGYAYGFGFAIFVTSLGQPTFYEYFNLDRECEHPFWSFP